MKERSRVAVISAEYSSLGDVFPRMFDLVGKHVLDNAAQIAVKINLCDYKTPETGATTHPLFLAAFLDWIKSEHPGLKVFVVESDASQARPDLISHWLGIDEIINTRGAAWVNLSRDSCTKKLVQGLRFKTVKVPHTILTSDVLISMAKMKTHSLTTISCSVKNQFGCIAYPKKVMFHPFLDEAIVDACAAMRPQFAIVDGIIGMGGPKGPVDGVPIHAGLVVAGMDPVAVDSACAKIMGLNARGIGHLRKAEAAGLGSMEFDVCGDGIPASLPDFETNESYRRVLHLAHTLQRKSISWG
jgi:uncharacterized protein (DUF362 family)